MAIPHVFSFIFCPVLRDEIDKSDIDLPNDLLNVFEDGKFIIHEIARSPRTKDGRVKLFVTGIDERVPISFGETYGQIQCHAFPFIVMTSNEEKAFPPAFLRRCLKFYMDPPSPDKLVEIVKAHITDELSQKIKEICEAFITKCNEPDTQLATDQLLNAVYLFTKNVDPLAADKQKLREVLFRNLSYDQKDN